MPRVAEEVVRNRPRVGSEHDVHVRGQEAGERLTQLSLPSLGIRGRPLRGTAGLGTAAARLSPTARLRTGARRLPGVVGFAEPRRHRGRGGLLKERITAHALAAQLTQPEIGDQEGSGVTDLGG